MLVNLKHALSKIAVLPYSVTAGCCLTGITRGLLPAAFFYHSYLLIVLLVYRQCIRTRHFFDNRLNYII